MADKNYKIKFGLSDGTTKEVQFTAPQGDPGSDAIKLRYISPTGNDNNDGLTKDTPKKTVKACINDGANRISAKRGVYKEVISLFDIGELEIFPTDNDQVYSTSEEWSPIVFDMSDNIALSSLETYNSIKKVAYSNSNNTQFDKVFIKKSQSPIQNSYGERYNSTIWLLSSDEKTVCIKLKPVLTIAECEAETNTFSYVDGYIYINADMTGVEKIIVPTNWESGITIKGAEKVVLKEVEVRFSGTYNIHILNCPHFDLYKCSARFTSYGSGIDIDNANGILMACYATKNFDGFGVSGYGHTTFIDCISEFNFDDGVSHHDGTEGTFIGGRYEGNGKGGNTPAYGAKVSIYGGLYKNNKSFGIGYLYTSDLNPASGMVQGAVMVGNPIGLSVNANCEVIEIGCHYVDNDVDKAINGNVSQYNTNYVKAVNNIKPDTNGNVTIEIPNSDGGDTLSYTNVLPLAVGTDGLPYVGENGEKGYKAGYRISSSGSEKTSTVNCCTLFITCKAGDVIRIKNAELEQSGYSTAYFFDSAFTKTAGTINTGDFVLNNGVFTFTIPNYAIAYTRITFGTITNDTIITVNEEITD